MERKRRWGAQRFLLSSDLTLEEQERKSMERKRRSRAQRFLLSSDLTLELLLRLPAKSLRRFRCVCKSWCDLISDPDFGKRHRARSLLNPALLTCSSSVDYHGKGKNLTFDVSFHVSLFNSEGTLVRQFTKRGICQHMFVLSTFRDLLLTSNFVFNIATQEVVIALPLSYMAIALGRVLSTDEFKVLAVDCHLKCYKVLTLGTHQWRDVDAPSRINPSGVFANGAIHGRWEKDANEIYSFNLEREEWGVVAATPPIRSPRVPRELNGYLCLLDMDDTNNSMDIWLLKDYDKGLWVKEYTICLSTLNAIYDWAVNPILIEDDGRLLVQVDGHSLQLYDPKTQNSIEIQHFENIEDTDILHVKCFSSLGHRKNLIKAPPQPSLMSCLETVKYSSKGGEQ